MSNMHPKSLCGEHLAKIIHEPGPGPGSPQSAEYDSSFFPFVGENEGAAADTDIDEAAHRLKNVH